MTRQQAVRCVVGTTMIWIGLIILTAWILAGSKHSAKGTGRLVSGTGGRYDNQAEKSILRR